ncbi:MAG: hypothetical protein ACJAR1_000733 [Rubritalea sp.]|jgi:hypothetical protein
MRKLIIMDVLWEQSLVAIMTELYGNLKNEIINHKKYYFEIFHHYVVIWFFF